MCCLSLIFVSLSASGDAAIFIFVLSVDVEVGVGRSLLQSGGSRRHRLASSIIQGDVETAARTLVEAVGEGDGTSAVLGLHTAQENSGSQFSVVQVSARFLAFVILYLACLTLY